MSPCIFVPADCALRRGREVNHLYRVTLACHGIDRLVLHTGVPDPHWLLLPLPPAPRTADQREPGSPELAENPRESTLGAQGFQYPESVDFTRPPRPAREPRCYSTRLRRAGLNRHNQRAAITPARSHSVINHELQSRSRDRHQSSALYFAIVNTHHRLDRLSRTSLQQAY
jgi:hypothetical protein